MGKKSRARVAAVGTRKDPERRVVEGGKAERADRRRLGRMLILSGRRTSTLLARI